MRTNMRSHESGDAGGRGRNYWSYYLVLWDKFTVLGDGCGGHGGKTSSDVLADYTKEFRDGYHEHGDGPGWTG